MNSLISLIVVFIIINIVDSYCYHRNNKKPMIKLLLSNNNNNNDFIDAEIVDNKKSSTLSSSSSSSNEKSKGKGIISSLFNFGKKLLSNDESKLSPIEKKKKEQKQQMNKIIDDAFKGKGLVGGVMGGMLKGVGNIITESFSEMTNDQTIIQEAVIMKLSSSLLLSSKLGSDIQCGFPLQSSSNSINVNGKIQKSFSQVIQVQGRKGYGIVQFAGNIVNEKVEFTQLLFQDNNNMQIIDILKSGGSNNGSGSGSGTIIDTESY